MSTLALLIASSLAIHLSTGADAAWSQIDVPGSLPAGRSRCAATFLPDGDGGTLELFGGALEGSRVSNSLISVAVNGSWHSVHFSTSPSPRQFASAAQMGLPGENERPKMFMYGGQTADGPSDEAWEVGVDRAPTWARVELTAGSDAMGKLPGPRFGHSLDAVPVPGAKWSPYPGPDGLAVLFGGSNGSHVLADAWMLDMGGREWHLLNSGVEPPGYPAAPGARVHHSSAIVPEVNPNAAPMLFIFGGVAGSDPTQQTVLGDLWAYSLGEYMWANISSLVRADPLHGTPSARQGAALRVVSAAPTLNRTVLLLFGGVDKDGDAMSDSWTLTVPRDMWGTRGGNQASWQLQQQDGPHRQAMQPTARAYAAAATVWQSPIQDARGAIPVADGVMLFGGEGDEEEAGNEPALLNDAFHFTVESR